MPGRPAVPVREVDLDWRSVAWVLGAFVALVAFTGLVRNVPRTTTSVAIAVLVALALDPLVAALQRRTPLSRAGAVAVIVAGFVLVASVIGILLVPRAVAQARDLGGEIPRVAHDLTRLPVVGPTLERRDVPARIERWVNDLPERLAGNATPLTKAAHVIADGAVAATVTALLALALLVDAEALLRGARRLVPPPRRARAEELARLAYEVVGRYVAGSLLVATIAGVSVLVAGLVLRVPLTPLAAVWVALWDLVPQIGGAAGGVPFVLLALTHGAGTGLAAAVFFMLYLQFENNILSPLVVGKAVKLSPPATMAAALVGVSAGGVVGALLAVPVVGATKAVYLELRHPSEKVP